MPHADFVCPGCKSRVTLHWTVADGPPADEGCEFCDAVEPLRRDWAGHGAVGAVPGAGGSPARSSTSSR